ncbi:hypothetical protein GLAREA_12587 [Glarea lozoyensis ATCC 20868]|uniref:Uncharacterized protein n=1 Tax=Glarea lozoyensis (strain ATCC 20868 / MF5171) TaxID=1116229 RepID=S3D2D0_GLAL2|nr:uncharacterized protein GLAREA_12587 [Glarea lozoyensis ATCC 20868]EPE31284.1 hypothetical protein GLAREA_12587 [Glarea lozoyensis ATCC 20868]
MIRAIDIAFQIPASDPMYSFEQIMNAARFFPLRFRSWTFKVWNGLTGHWYSYFEVDEWTYADFQILHFALALSGQQQEMNAAAAPIMHQDQEIRFVQDTSPTQRTVGRRNKNSKRTKKPAVQAQKLEGPPLTITTLGDIFDAAEAKTMAKVAMARDSETAAAEVISTPKVVRATNVATRKILKCLGPDHKAQSV